MVKRRKLDLYVGIFLLALMLLKFSEILKMIGIEGRFVDIVVIAVALYLIIMGIRK